MKMKISLFRNNRLTIILRSQETGKRIEKIKFSKEETAEIRRIADLLDMTEKELLDEAFDYILSIAVTRKYFK